MKSLRKAGRERYLTITISKCLWESLTRIEIRDLKLINKYERPGRTNEIDTRLRNDKQDSIAFKVLR